MNLLLFCTFCFTSEKFFTGEGSWSPDLRFNCPCGCQDTITWENMTRGQRRNAADQYESDLRRKRMERSQTSQTEPQINLFTDLFKDDDKLTEEQEKLIDESLEALRELENPFESYVNESRRRAREQSRRHFENLLRPSYGYRVKEFLVKIFDPLFIFPR